MTEPIRRHVLAALVANEPGVLTNVAGMFAARGFNIDSLVVGRTENPAFSRITLVVRGDSGTIEQVRKQLEKLVSTMRVVDFVGVDTVERDLILCRVSATPGQRAEVIELASLFRAKIVDVGIEDLMIEMSASEDKIEAFTDLIRPYGIIEMGRTGVIAMRRGEKVKGQTPVSRRDNVVTDSSAAKTSDIDPSELPPG